MKDHVSQVEKEQAIAAFASKQERMFWTGRIIIWIVAILDIVKAIVSLIVDEAPGNFLHLIGVIALSITLIRGFTWVRVLRGTLAFFYAIGLFGIILIVLVPGMIEAKKAGSDYIVVGRPITAAEDPVAAYERCVTDFCD